MEIPQVKISQSLLIGLAIGGAILAIVLFYENQKMRKDLITVTSGKKPCTGCQEKMVAAATNVPPDTKYEVKAPMPTQSHDDPNHPPEVVI